jgi:hypothetical protein
MSCVTSPIRIGGRDGLLCSYFRKRVNPGEPAYESRAMFLWRAEAGWTENMLCTVRIAAQKSEAYMMLTNSLKTVRLFPEKLKIP